MRVYCAATQTAAAQALGEGELGPAPVTGFAVTAALRSWYLDDDDEELEYAAFTEAARGSLRLLDSDPLASRRRLVISADVPEEFVTQRPELDRAVVRVSVPVLTQWWACVHIDNADVTSAIAAAAAAVIPAELGDADSQFAVDSALGHELEWYDVSELDELLKPSGKPDS